MRTRYLVVTAEEASQDSQTHQLRRQLQRQLRHRVELAVTDNASTMISVRRERERYQLRLHHMFLDAEPEVVRALGRYVAVADRDASRLLGRFIDIHQRKIQEQSDRERRRRRLATRRPPRLITAGAVHDLAAIFAELDARYFDRRTQARITWGPRLSPLRRRHESVRLGSFALDERLIRVHRTLDRAPVPRFFVEWVVFHEMLHAKHEMPLHHGRRQYHTPAFLAEEATFAARDASLRFERDCADLLLTF